MVLNAYIHRGLHNLGGLYSIQNEGDSFLKALQALKLVS